MPLNADITAGALVIQGERQDRNSDILAKIGRVGREDGGDTLLVLLADAGPAEDQVHVDLAVPLDAWEDNINFFRGFILFEASKVIICFN